jgi:hypothetical protein
VIFDQPTKLSRRSVLSTAGLTGIGLAVPKAARKIGTADTSEINLDNLTGTGVHSTLLLHAIPNKHGVHLQRSLTVSGVERAVAFAGEWWPAGGNRVYPHVVSRAETIPEGAIFLLFQQKSGEYLALLPMANTESYAWLSGDGRSLSIKLGTLGKGEITGEQNLFAWSRDASAYRAIAQAWKAGVERLNGAALLRDRSNTRRCFDTWDGAPGRRTAQTSMSRIWCRQFT